MEETFTAKISDDKEFLYQLGEFFESMTNTYLRQAIRFASSSEFGRNCDYSKKAMQLHIKLQHKDLVKKLRLVLEQK